MAEPAPTGSDVSAGTYRCNYQEEITAQSVKSLPLPEMQRHHIGRPYQAATGKEDPYPDWTPLRHVERVVTPVLRD